MKSFKILEFLNFKRPVMLKKFKNLKLKLEREKKKCRTAALHTVESTGPV